MSEAEKESGSGTNEDSSSTDDKEDGYVQIADSGEVEREAVKEDLELLSWTLIDRPGTPSSDISNLELSTDGKEKDSDNFVITSSLSLTPENDDEEVNPEFNDYYEIHHPLYLKEENCQNAPMSIKPHDDLENIGLRANYFQLTFKNEIIYWYSVNIKLESETVECIQSRQQNRELIFQTFQENESLRGYKPIYDGRHNLYTTELIPIHKSLSFEVTRSENHEVRKFQVTLKPVIKKGRFDNVISLRAPLESFPFQNRISEEVKAFVKTVLRPVGSENELSYVGKHIFFEDFDQPEDRVQVRLGYSHDIVMTHKGLIVVLDISAARFHKSQNILDFVSDVVGRNITLDPVLSETDFETLSRVITEVGLKVSSLYFPNIKPLSVKDVTKFSSKDMKLSNESETTVEEHFRQSHGVELKYPNLPCLHISASGDSEYMPFEVCHIPPGVRMKGRLSHELNTLVFKQTCLPPKERFDQIVRYAKITSVNSATNMDLCGLQLDLEPFKLTGKVHKPPFIKYSKRYEMDPIVPNATGLWMMKEDKQFLEAVGVRGWMLISFENPTLCPLDNLMKFSECLCKFSVMCGLHMKEPVEIKIVGEDEPTSDALFYAKEKDVDLVVVVLHSTRDVRYGEVKFIAELHLGLVTQCVTGEKLCGKEDTMLAANLCMKINSKMGGSNHAIYKDFCFSESPAIIFGARTNVPPTSVSSSTHFASIASVVGSLDSHPFKYSASCRAQLKVKKNKWRTELILELKDMVKKILTTFIKKTNTKPKKIIFFRNGISDEHFNQLLAFEIPMIKKACEEIQSHYCPDLTYITVQKKRRTRFKPEVPEDDDEETGNIPAGTTVDTDITRPSAYNYYLCSHETNGGTSRPTCYTVLYDENYFEREEIQELSYHLCHTYARCNRSISLPTPLKYAALVAKRARDYINIFVKRVMSKDEPYDPEALTLNVMNLLKEIEEMDNGMFFV